MSGFVDIDDSKKELFNKAVSHPLQSFEWGEFRKKTGLRVIRRGLFSNGKLIEAFTLTLHRIPKTKYYAGYLPKGTRPTEELIFDLEKIGKENNCIFIQIEPDVRKDENKEFNFKNLRTAAHPLFTKFTFVLDITKPEDELLKNMHSKTRYNIRIAEKHKVRVREDNSNESFNHYLKLMTETTNRQGFYAHTPKYHERLFQTIQKKASSNMLSYHLLNAVYKPENENEQVLTSWVLLVFKDRLYYPYGASSRKHREVMANNLIAWEAIKFGKKLGLKKFDMWGALGPEPDKNDPWYGFHRFKEGYGADLVEFVGSYDLVIKPAMYEIYKLADKVRWGLLKLKTQLHA